MSLKQQRIFTNTQTWVSQSESTTLRNIPSGVHKLYFQAREANYPLRYDNTTTHFLFLAFDTCNVNVVSCQILALATACYWHKSALPFPLSVVIFDFMGVRKSSKKEMAFTAIASMVRNLAGCMWVWVNLEVTGCEIMRKKRLNIQIGLCHLSHFLLCCIALWQDLIACRAQGIANTCCILSTRHERQRRCAAPTGGTLGALIIWRA